MQNQKNNITMIGAGLTGLAFCNLLRDENIKVSLIDINSKNIKRKINISYQYVKKNFKKDISPSFINLIKKL